MKNYIQQDIIDNLPKIEMAGLSDDENRYVNQWIKYTLQYAKDYNDSNEVGVMLDKSDWDKYDTVLGQEKSVTYNTEKMIEWLDVGNDNLIIIHNHPSDMIFSDRDINNFCKSQAVNTMIVVGNKGIVYVLQKLDGFDKNKLLHYYSIATMMNKHKFKRSEILQHTLESYQSKIKCKFRREDISC